MILFLYFSGTGNTKHVVSTFASLYNQDSKVLSIEHKNIDFKEAIEKASEIFLAFPIYGSMMPFIMEDFIKKHKQDFNDKKISSIVTQILFSGDGGALPFYLLKDIQIKKGHSIHINMPNNATDVFFLRSKNRQEANKKIEKADIKIKHIIQSINNGKTIKHGRRFYSWALGYFVQRLYAISYMTKLRSKLNINHDLCTLCNTCVDICPTENLTNDGNQIITSNTCTLCYRCINTCPSQAISLLSKNGPKTQFIHDTYN